MRIIITLQDQSLIFRGTIKDGDLDWDMLILMKKNITLKEQKEVRLANFINLNENWLLQAAIRYDVETKKSLRNRLSLVYIDDCVSFELGFRRKFAEYRDLKPTNSFMIKLKVYTFGGGDIDSSKRLDKLWERVE